MTTELKKALADILARAETIDAKVEALLGVLQNMRVVDSAKFQEEVLALAKSKHQIWIELRQQLERAIDKEEASLSPIDTTLSGQGSTS